MEEAPVRRLHTVAFFSFLYQISKDLDDRLRELQQFEELHCPTLGY